MPAEVFEEAITLRIGLLDALPVTSAADSSYPFPRLQTAGSSEEREFLAIVLENPYLRVTIVPALGGRILRVFDKRTSNEVLSPRETLEVLEGGPRGATLPDGIQLRILEDERLNALGGVGFQLDPAQEEEEDAGVWLGESSVAGGLSWHLRISLPPDRAEIHVAVRVLNRTFKPLPYNGGLSLGGGSWGVESPRHQLGQGPNGLTRFSGEALLAPRQVDSWAVKLTPVSGLGDSVASSLAGGMNVGELIRIQVSRPFMGAKVLLLTPDGQTLEATMDLYPEQITEVPLNGLSPTAAAVKDARGTEVLRWPLPESLQPEQCPRFDDAPVSPFSIATRHLAHTLFAIEAFKVKDFETADAELEQALLYNGEDPLVWWAKAIAQRRLGVEEDRPELPNAHYLAPLEPALRAEAFLSQSSEQGREANPLLKSMMPEDMVEVACLLLEHGLPDEATRWIDEALRHHDLAVLHYLQADALLEGTRMEAEAAQHVVLAARAQLPPYPWRPVELDALTRLRQRFSTDVRLNELAQITG
jgi:hypothetical protein